MTLIDFTRSLPPVPPRLGESLASALCAVADLDLAVVGRASSPVGRDADRDAAARWLAPRFGGPIDPDRILLANGTQSAVLLLLQACVPAGRRLATECLSYGMLRRLTEVAGVEVEGLPIDPEGLMPDALDRACASGEIGAIYCNPTFHNPTAAVMSTSRRLEIGAVARLHSVPIIEDDPLGLLYSQLPPPIAALAPECTWFVSSLTKTIAQGMRLAFMIAPTMAERDRIIDLFARLSHWVPAPLMTAAATWLIETGRGIGLRQSIADENIAREAAARRILPPGCFTAAPGSPHIWLPMDKSEADRISLLLEQAGVMVRGEELFRVDDASATGTGIRLSLSSPLERACVIDGLERVRSVLEGTVRPQRDSNLSASRLTDDAEAVQLNRRG